ncbi:uncharacterized protein LOC119385216 [Rhipicephalus sanguineus]|uniref:uncharacterized protein LOC119385216 n=1 Tax=Rhipicephalus sanguineus TaxID=34632 RepID=UPI0020C21968|nr:uncharacterized protein LOC119385216 [Rhipicephalus sanguineus]
MTIIIIIILRNNRSTNDRLAPGIASEALEKRLARPVSQAAPFLLLWNASRAHVDARKCNARSHGHGRLHRDSCAMIFSSTCNFSAVAAVVVLTPLSWPFVLCFSCRVATWMYRLYLIALVAIVAFAICYPSRRQGLVNDLYRYSVPPDFDADILEEEPSHGCRGVASADSLGFKSSEHVSVAEAKRQKA